MNCGYCGKAHSSGNDRCRGCGVPKSSESVLTKEPKRKQIRARVFQPTRLTRAFSDIPIINFVIGLGVAASPILGYFALVYVHTHYAGSEIVSGFVIMAGLVILGAFFVNLIEDN